MDEWLLDKDHLQEVCITKFEVPDQQNDEILLIDANCQYEDLPDDVTDRAGEDEFDGSDDHHCTDNEDNSNDS